MTARSRLAGLALAALASSCGSNEVPAPPDTRALPVGVVARVGTELVATATVARIAERQGIEASLAVGHALSDALLAQGGRVALSPATVTSIERAAAARSVAEAFALEAKRQGPPTPAELEVIVREQWLELDRPPAARTVHAVVLSSDPAREAAARAVAEKLAEAVHSALSAEEFVKQAKAVPKAGFDLVVEELPFVTADGRAFRARENSYVAQPGSFDKAYAEAANALVTPGEQSKIVKSGFGFHVIRLEERLPAAGVPAADRPAALASEVNSRRAGRARRDWLERLRPAANVQVDRAFDELTSRLQKSP